MADFTNAPTLTPMPSTATAAGATTPNLIPVQVTVDHVAQGLQILTRGVQTNAVPTELTNERSLTLATVLGDIKVSLPQNITRQVQQAVTQQIMALIETQRPLTLALQPGSPPSLGMLLVPAPVTNAGAAQAAAHPVVTVPQPTLSMGQQAPVVLPQVQVGSQLSAVVLPPLPVTGGQVPASTVAVTPMPVIPLATVQSAPMQPTSAQSTTLALAQQPPLSSTNTTAVIPNEAGSNAAPPVIEPVLLSRASKLYAQPQALNQALPPPAHQQNSPTVIAAQTEPSLATTNLLPPSYLVNSYRAPPPTAVTTAPTAPVITTAAARPALNNGPVPAAPQATPPPVQQGQPVAVAPIPSQVQTATANTTAVPVQPPLSPHLAEILQPGQDVALRVVSMQATAAQAPIGQAVQAQMKQPTTAVPMALVPTTTEQFTATVVGQAPDGKLILQAGASTLFVRSATTAPIGATLLLEVTPHETPSALTLPRVESLSFPSLPSVLSVLTQLDPTAQTRLLASLPQADDSLSGALLQMLAAFKRPDAASWLGKPVAESLAFMGKAELLQNLSKETKEQVRASSDPVVGEWRSFPLPLYDAGAFQTLMLHVHRDKDQQQSNDPAARQNAGKVRFLIDMRLSKLGVLQLDGFVQPKKIDMVLRSENLLPEGLHHNLRIAYNKAMSAVGFAGTLAFQVGRQHWVNMRAETPKGIVT